MNGQRTGYRENNFENEMMRLFGRTTRKDIRGGCPAGRGYPMVYICSPYAAETPEGIQRNIKAAKQYCRYAIGKRRQPVASHLLYPQFLNDSDEMDREMGMAFGLALMRNCTEVWVFGKPSAGMKEEIREALREKIPVVYVNDTEAFGAPPWNPIESYARRHTQGKEDGNGEEDNGM